MNEEFQLILNSEHNMSTKRKLSASARGRSGAPVAKPQTAPSDRPKPKLGSEEAAKILKRDAFHEAGHIGLDLLFSTEESIVFVEVNPSVDEESFMKGARVRNQGINRFEAELGIALQRRNTKYARYVARTRIAQLMAGAAATNRIEPNPDPEWYQEELDMLQWEATPAWDVYRAALVASQVYPQPSEDEWAPEAIELVRQGCRLADKMLSIPSLWAAVEALAMALTQTHRLSGDQAIEVMEKAIAAHPDGDPQSSLEFQQWSHEHLQNLMNLLMKA